MRYRAPRSMEAGDLWCITTPWCRGLGPKVEARPGAGIAGCSTSDAPGACPSASFRSGGRSMWNAVVFCCNAIAEPHTVQRRHRGLPDGHGSIAGCACPPSARGNWSSSRRWPPCVWPCRSLTPHRRSSAVISSRGRSPPGIPSRSGRIALKARAFRSSRTRFGRAATRRSSSSGRATAHSAGTNRRSSAGARTNGRETTTTTPGRRSSPRPGSRRRAGASSSSGTRHCSSRRRST